MARAPTVWVEDSKLYRIRSGYGMNFICCDCGLTHRMFFKAAGRGWMNFMCRRDNRATSGRRRAGNLRRVARAIVVAEREQI